MKRDKLLTGRVSVMLLAMLCCLLWGSAFPFIKLGYRELGIAQTDSFSQLLFAGVRFILAGVLAVLIGSLVQRRALLPDRSDLKKAAVLSLFQTVSQYTFFYLGLARTTGMKSSIITGSNVFFSLVLSALIFRQEKLTPGKLAGCLIGFAGVVLINLRSGESAGFTLTGEGFILFSAMSYGVSSCLIKRFSKEHDPVLLSGWQFILGGAVMTAVALCFGGSPGTLTLKGILILLWLAFVSAAAFSVWSLLLSHNPVSEVSVYGFTNPMFGALLSFLLLGEHSASSLPRTVISLLLVAAGIITVNISQRTDN